MRPVIHRAQGTEGRASRIPEWNACDRDNAVSRHQQRAGEPSVGARVFHDTQRKLKTLEGLVALLRRPAAPGGAR